MRRHPIHLSVALLSFALLLPGCVASVVSATTTSASNAGKTSGTQIDQDQIDQFQKGVATMTEVEAKLGQPQQTSKTPDGGLKLIYTGTSATGNTQSYVPFARWANGSETTITTRTVTFVFDPAGKLVDTTTAETSLTCRFGHCPDSSPT